MSSFSINKWFNEHTIRIVGTPQEPFFYACDIGDVLELTNIRKSIKDFDDLEIVSDEVRARLGIKTRRIVDGQERDDNSINLLTESGVYRLIISSRLPVVRQFKRFIYQCIRDVRAADPVYTLVNTADYTDIVEQNKRLQQYKNQITKRGLVTYVFTRHLAAGDNPYDFIHDSERDDYWDRYRSTNPPDDDEHTLYKLTTRPSSDDYGRFTFAYYVYGIGSRVRDEIDSISEFSLEINYRAHSYCSYHVDIDLCAIDSGEVVSGRG